MANSGVQFLGEGDRPLARQIADAILKQTPGGFPVDLRSCEVWVPTAGAERRIRAALAEAASDPAEQRGGVLSPRFRQPMQALLPEDLPEQGAPRPATQIEREAAWALVLRASDAETRESLFGTQEQQDDDRSLLAAGRVLCGLCDLLAEGGLRPDSTEVREVCSEDLDRWNVLGNFFRQYLRMLQSFGLTDPNELRRERLAAAERNETPRPERLFVACIPDLPFAAQMLAKHFQTAGTEVVVFVWNPSGSGGGFDAWGRPLPEDWKEAPVPVASESIHAVRTAEEEAVEAVRFLVGAQPPGDYALAVAEPALNPAIRAEILARGGRAFDPEGTPLARTEPATIALEWLAWSENQNLRTLRRLFECPHFSAWIGRRSKSSPTTRLRLCDYFLAEVLSETLAQAEAFLPHWETTDSKGREDQAAADNKDAAKRLFEALRKVARYPADQVLNEAFEGASGPVDGLSETLEIWRQLGESPVFKNWPRGRRLAFQRAVQSRMLYGASHPGDVELSGWLEAPWLEGACLALCGCTEGNLPASVDSHPFLPDSKRAALNLQSNASRSARDAFLLAGLAASRPAGRFRLSFAKFASDGSPTLPSRFLLRCEDLPRRALQLFEGMPAPLPKPVRKNSWRWSLPESLRAPAVKKISPTDFKSYLLCPVRYYFQRVLYLEAFDPRAREMDALVFGTLVHKVLEDFANEIPHPREEPTIAKRVLELLDAAALRVFGASPPPAVRVQLEAARVRLRAFAALQAEQFEEGWEILEAEAKLSADAADGIHIGSLPLSAKLDRVDEHPEKGIRVLDFKTFSSPKTPEQTHLTTARGPAPTAVVDEALLDIGKKHLCWVDLQLPLYRRIAEKFYPGKPVSTGYFVLPSDPSKTEIAEFPMDDAVYESALSCAAAIADRVSRGIFWPPVPHAGPWEDAFAALFLNEDPTECFDADTIRFLKGER